MTLPANVAKQVIAEHSRRPRHHGDLPGATHAGDGDNPGCGDHVRVMLDVQGGVIQDARFTGRGCAISTASASLMTGLIRGKTPAEALALADEFSAMLRTGEAAPALGDAAALSGVHTLHTRVKCAALSWQTLRALLEENN